MNWNDLKEAVSPKPVDVEIKLPYDRVLSVKVVTLTYPEWVEAGFEIPDPPVPLTRMGANGEKLPNRDDVKYQQLMAETNIERSYWRLHTALSKAGWNIPGTDKQAQIETLKTTFDSAVFQSLVNWLARAALEGKASVQAVADTFHAGDAANT